MDSRSILKFIRARADRPMKIKEMARELDIPAEEYPSFRKAVKELLVSGELVELKRNRIGIPEALNVLVGKISVTRSGQGFVKPENRDVEYLIPPTQMWTAMDGDKVMIRAGGTRQDRPTATVIRIVERAARMIVGVFKVGQTFSYVVPDNHRIHRDLYIAPNRTLDAAEGEKVVARLLNWDDPYRNPEGEIIERLGFPGEPGVDMLTVMRSFGLPEKFPQEVLDAAERAAATHAEEDVPNRLDLTNDCIYTIDPEDAKDHDDAISVTRRDHGYRLAVHIADVSHFVREGTPLDTEAFQRGNSVYLPGMVIPMLPELLSSDLCSLREDRRRFAFSIFIDYDPKGKALGWELARTLIQSRASLTYEEVQQFFDSGAVTSKIRPVSENLLVARELARLLHQRRLADGSLDFDLPEAKIILGSDGEVIELGHRVRLESHRLIEEFMLAANRAVALEVFRNAQPFLYRVHDRPDMEKLEAFSLLMARLGHKFPVSKQMRPTQFSRFLAQVADSPEAEFINELLLRSMQKAVYQQKNIGHFGLAFSHYTHFTSPIRRYPDLMVHRLLGKMKHGRYSSLYAKKIGNVIDHVGTHCSETERQAEAAERQAVKVKQVAFMAKHLGDEYNGLISGVTPFGFFVRLDKLGVEGMVRVSAIDDDYYVFDEQNYRFVGRRKKRTFRLGDQLRVRVQRVDTTRHEIDLYLAEDRRPEQHLKKMISARPDRFEKRRPSKGKRRIR